MVRKRKLDDYDEQRRAESLLQDSVNKFSDTEENLDEQVSVAEALQERPLLKYNNNRTRTRVLFVTNDTSFLNPADDNLERFFAVAEYFDEMHIMVLRSGTIPTKPVLRVRSNIWVYIASAKYWWWTPVIANEDVAKQQLFFAGGFRPDVVVALEPFESGLAALWIGKSFSRPVQIHVRQNFLRKGFKSASKRNKWRVRIAWYVLRRAKSVRVQTKEIKEAVADWCKSTSRINLLPWINKFAEIKNSDSDFDVHDAYPMYEKILLFIGPLDYTSTLFGVIDAMKYVLANPKVGLVVLGDGPTKAECEEKMKKLGLHTQVVFPKKVPTIVPYLKSADVLVLTDQTALADELAMQGAVAKIPSIMSETEARSEVFTDTENAFICDDEEKCFIDKFQEVVHNETIRRQFKNSLEQKVAPFLSAQAATYQETYRNIVESVFLETTEEEADTSPLIVKENSETVPPRGKSLERVFASIARAKFRKILNML